MKGQQKEGQKQGTRGVTIMKLYFPREQVKKQMEEKQETPEESKSRERGRERVVRVDTSFCRCKRERRLDLSKNKEETEGRG